MLPEIRAQYLRAGQILTAEGWRSLWFKILGETVYRRLVLIQKHIEATPESVPDSSGTGCRLMTIEDVDGYLLLRPEAARKEVERRLASGHYGFVALDDGAIVHACWAVTSEAHIEYLDLDVVLAAGAVYVYEVFTSPPYRGRGISSLRSLEMERYLRGKGHRRLVAAVGPENWAATRSKTKAGYDAVGSIGYWRLGRFRYRFCRCRRQDAPLRLASHME